MDTINEEEKQFLKTLSRGRKVFERTVNKLTDNILPGKKSIIVKIKGHTLFVTCNIPTHTLLALIVSK